MDHFEVSIPFDPARLSPNKRMHWAKKARLTRESRELGRAAWINAGRPHFDGPVDVRITVFRGRSMDEYNAARGLKGCTDGLFVDALTPDDSPDWVHFLELTVVASKEHRRNPCVVYRVDVRNEK